MRFYIVDAFTDRTFSGNTAGVVWLGEEPFPLDDAMRLTAAELRYSETAFVRRTGPDSLHTRFFTPTEEVALCGHATVGAFCALCGDGLLSPGEYHNLTGAGPLAVQAAADHVLLELASPRWIHNFSLGPALDHLYHIMGAWYRSQQTDLVPSIVSTGLPDIILPVLDEAELDGLRPDFSALRSLTKDYGVVGVHAFTHSARDGYIHCRNFAPLYGIDEEAATGTANGALAYYLYRNNLLSGYSILEVRQGEAMGRPSKVDVLLTADEKGVSIQVGGASAVLAKGELDLSCAFA